MRPIRLTENDIVRIVKRLLTENQDDHKLDINFTSTFPSGQFDEKYINASEFKNKMDAIYHFIQSFQNTKLEITVVGGESQVTNPKEFPEKGSLATKRCQIISQKIKESLQMNHVDLQNITFKVGQPVIGSTPYKKGDNPNQQAYTNEQFIRVTISVVGEDAPPTWCNAADSGSGNVGNPQNGFVADYKRYDLKGDVGSIVLKFDPVVVPDMFVVRYDNQTYNTGFVGDGSIQYRVTIATILGTYYQGKDMPPHFAGVQIAPIQQAAWAEFEKAMGDQNLYQNFLDDIAPIFKVDPSRYKNFRQFRKSPEFAKLVWSDMTPGINQASHDVQMVDGYRQLTIAKKRGVSLLELWVVGVLGTTRWRLKFGCEQLPQKPAQVNEQKKRN
jgi:hypothetical protein